MRRIAHRDIQRQREMGEDVANCGGCDLPLSRQRFGRTVGVLVDPFRGRKCAHATQQALGRTGDEEHMAVPFDPEGGATAFRPRALDRRSEEHTSELQSLMRISYAVFCLKKKKTIKTL